MTKTNDSIRISVTLTADHLEAIASLISDGADALLEKIETEGDYTNKDIADAHYQVETGNDAMERLKEAFQTAQTEPPLTYEQRYLQGNSNKCPMCLSSDIEADSVDINGNQAHQDVGCNNCGESWTDEYTLTGIVRALGFNPGDSVGTDSENTQAANANG